MGTRVDKLTRENAELRASLQLSGSKMRREYEAMFVEKDRLIKLVEQLKNEKTHLVETVLALSNEVDAQKSSTQLVEERLRHLQADALSRSARERIGRVLDVLEARGLTADDFIVQEIRAAVSQEELSSPLPLPLSGKGVGIGKLPQAPCTTPTVTTSTATSGVSLEALDQRSHRLDAESLKVNEALYRQHQLQQLQHMQTPLLAAGGILGTGHDAPSYPAGGGLVSSTLRNHMTRNGSVKSRESRRKKTLERDETESVISSVSTHRSGRSHRSAASSTKRPLKSQITAENLAILNRLNGDDVVPDVGVGVAKARHKAAPTPATSRKMKTTEEAAASWWPRLF